MNREVDRVEIGNEFARVYYRNPAGDTRVALNAAVTINGEAKPLTEIKRGEVVSLAFPDNNPTIS